MKVRIHDTGPDGRPVACTGDTFAGRTFLEVVEGMMLNPFTQDANPVAYMRRILAGIGAGEGPLPDEPDEAAEAFLSRLVAAGYAAFAPDGSGDEKEKTDVNQPPKPEPPPPPPSERDRLRARIVEIESEVERLTISMVRLWVRLNDMKKEG